TQTIHFFFSSRRRHTRSKRDWSSDVCSSDLLEQVTILWQTDEVRSIRPSVADEIRQGLWFFERSLIGALGELAGDWKERFPAAQIGRASCRERVWGAGGGGTVEDRYRQGQCE